MVIHFSTPSPPALRTHTHTHSVFICSAVNTSLLVSDNLALLNAEFNCLLIGLTVCQREIYHTNHSSFQSPNYPDNYPGNLSCSYRFVPSYGGYSMVIAFTDFQIEGATNGSCTNDYLQVPLCSSEKSMKKRMGRFSSA